MSPIIDISEFFKNSDVKAGDIITFITPAETKEVDFSLAKDGSGIKEATQVKVELADGRQKTMTLNKTTLKTLIVKYGNQSDTWVGKKFTVEFIKQAAFRKIIDVLCLTSLE